ncbi:hypothetical protein SISNIDRAFT_343434 [Sistotremastrum niveocremeum HHB9708]|uniref:F-box domain-containing protein n=1 Tax=Sistotremastrum niveocremeum HHB9708 TaxID=1314777 RepID=A0A164MKP1_9AGAM|nr:hypothetical protein SISNIDRAFT_343434 [Sistotremastrum niveocremeum HHB9708]
MATPRLWSSIDMDWPLPIIEMFSSRCQPISSDIVWNNTGTSDTGKASFLIGNVSKMVSLKLMLPLHLMPEPEGLFRSHEILPLPLPDMTNLTLSFPRSDIGELDDNLFAGNAPRLVDLCLLNVSGSFSPQIFRGLLYLRIYYTACKSSHVTHKLPLCDVIDLLRASPELRIFQFSVSDWDCTITATTSVPHFVAEKLQTVILDGWDRAAIKMFFTKVSSPSLTSLKIEAAPTMGEVEEIEENNMLCFLDDAPESVQSLLSRGRHLVVHNPPGSETATFSLSTTGSLVTHTPSVVLRTSAPEEHDWGEWIKGLYRTIPQLNLYLDLSQLRTFAFNYNGESRVSLDAISHLSCWREFLSQCVALEEIEIVGPDSWKPILRALGNIPILEENVPCPSLRVLRLVMPSVPEDPVLFEALWMRKKSGKRISQLIFMPYLPEHGGYEYDMLEYSESSERLEMLEMVVETTRRIPRNSRETVLGGKDAYETLPDEEDRLAFW